VFDGIHALIDHCCDAWNKLEAQPWTIMSLGMRDWAIGSDQRVLVVRRETDEE